jgi:hypothetical protein
MASPQVESASSQTQIIDYLPAGSGRSASKTAPIIDLNDINSESDTEGVLPEQTSKLLGDKDVKIEEESDNTELGASSMTQRTPTRQTNSTSVLQGLPTPFSIMTEPGNIIPQPDPLPQHLLDQVDEWYDRNPGKPPPFATTCKSNTFSVYGNTSESRFGYRHKSGKSLEVVVHTLPTNLYPHSLNKVNCKRLLVAKGDGVAPFIMHHASIG